MEIRTAVGELEGIILGCISIRLVIMYIQTQQAVHLKWCILMYINYTSPEVFKGILKFYKINIVLNIFFWEMLFNH